MLRSTIYKNESCDGFAMKSLNTKQLISGKSDIKQAEFSRNIFTYFNRVSVSWVQKQTYMYARNCICEQTTKFISC